MTKAEFNATLATIGWSHRALADKLSMHTDRAVRRWASGQNPIPPAIAGWLREVARTLSDLPPPREWQAARAHGEHLDGA